MDFEILVLIIKYGVRLILTAISAIILIVGLFRFNHYNKFKPQTEQGYTNRVLAMMYSSFLIGSSLIALAILHVGGYRL